jgi:CDP-glucose 4,6-dehydratase
VGDRQPTVGSFVTTLDDFYRGKKVLVTGHTGFKGGWLAIWLKLMGAEVTGFALPAETEPNLFSAANVGDGIVSTFGDIRELEAVKEIFVRQIPDIVIHNAAQALVRRSYREPVKTYATNVMGAVHVLEAARTTPSVRSVVVVTSDKCYENREWERGYEETDAMGGHDPYSSSKGAAELVTAAYRRSFFNVGSAVAVASARAGNVIGGGDWSEDRLIPDMVRGISANTPIRIRRPDSVRPWQHVLEPLSGYLLLAKKLYEDGHEFADAWNFGPRAEDSITTASLAEQVCSIWGKGDLRIEPDSDAPHEATFLRLNCAKSSQRLGWNPRLGLNRAVECTVDWYRAFYEGSSVSPREMTERQIRAYMDTSA